MAPPSLMTHGIDEGGVEFLKRSSEHEKNQDGPLSTILLADRSNAPLKLVEYGCLRDCQSIRFNRRWLPVFCNVTMMATRGESVLESETEKIKRPEPGIFDEPAFRETNDVESLRSQKLSTRMAENCK